MAGGLSGLVTAGGHVCTHSVTLRQTHILHEAVSAPGLRWPPPAFMRPHAASGNDVRRRWPDLAPGPTACKPPPPDPAVGSTLVPAPHGASRTSCSNIQCFWGQHTLPIQGDRDAVLHTGNIAQLSPCYRAPIHPGGLHWVKPQHHLFQAPFLLCGPGGTHVPIAQAGATLLGRMSPLCPSPVGAGCQGQLGAGRVQDAAGRNRGWCCYSCGSATCPRTHPSPGKSPGDAARGALHVVPGRENPHGVSKDGCSWRGESAHHGDLLRAASLSDMSKPTWGQRSRRASRWLRC